MLESVDMRNNLRLRKLQVLAVVKGISFDLVYIVSITSVSRLCPAIGEPLASVPRLWRAKPVATSRLLLLRVVEKECPMVWLRCVFLYSDHGTKCGTE